MALISADDSVPTNSTVFGGKSTDVITTIDLVPATSIPDKGTPLTPGSNDNIVNIVSEGTDSPFINAAGNDNFVLIGGTAFGGAGTDTIDPDDIIGGGGGSYINGTTVFGGSGTDNISFLGGSNNNQTLTGGSGNDILTITDGSNNNQTLTGGSGNDILIINDPVDVFDFTSGSDLTSYLIEQGAGYFRKVGDLFIPVDESEIQTEADLENLYYCDPDRFLDPVAQFMDPITGDIAPTLGGNTPSLDSYVQSDGNQSAIERYCVCVDELPFFNIPVVEAGVEGVDFWYDGAISPNFDQDAFWYRGGAPLEEGGESKYWFKFKNTDTTDVITGGGEYALVATKRDALDNGASLDSLTGDYVFSKSFVSPDGIRLYAGIDEAAVQELSNNGAEDIEVYRWDVAAGQIVGTTGREILGGRLDNRFDTIGEEYAGSLSELNNNTYVDTLA